MLENYSFVSFVPSFKLVFCLPVFGVFNNISVKIIMGSECFLTTVYLKKVV